MAVYAESRYGDPSDGARWVNVVLGAWLFFSAFLWRHTPAQRTNTWICGALVALIAFLAVRQPRARFLNTVLSVWIFLSAFALPHVTVGTMWNNALCAVAIFAVSLTAPAGELPGRRSTA